jgi:hypothetical protein
MEYVIIGILGLVVIALIVLYLKKSKTIKEMQNNNDLQIKLLNDLKNERDVIIKDLNNLSVEKSDLLNKNQELNNSVKNISDKYSPILNIDKEIENKKSDLDNVNKSIVEIQNQFQEKASSLNSDYQNAKNIYDKLMQEIAIYETDLELMSFGVYKPQYNFDTAEEYKEKLKQVLDKQKERISNKVAAICNTAWEVSGSKKLGQEMINRQIKLMLRAFNGECDTLIAKVKWNNIDKSNERIIKSWGDLNILGVSNDVKITEEFMQLKLAELKLTHEYEVKKYEEKEEQRRIQEIMREEERAQREYERAQQDAEKEELNYQKALEKAKKDLEKTSGSEFDKMSLKIKELEEQLKNAHEKKERALSMAQQTKSGYVYVISNIGSFGEDIYKIGMTRRLEPMDRVKELGDASVPFEFDVHAMIYSDNAPELERKLHKMYEKSSVNLVNMKKEFFKVDLNEVEDFIKTNHNSEILITKLAQAREYRETLAILEKMNAKPIQHTKHELPEQLFEVN